MTMLPDDYKISRLITRKTGNRTASIRVIAGEQDGSRDRVLSAFFMVKQKNGMQKLLVKRAGNHHLQE